MRLILAVAALLFMATASHARDADDVVQHTTAPSQLAPDKAYCSIRAGPNPG